MQRGQLRRVRDPRPLETGRGKLVLEGGGGPRERVLVGVRVGAFHSPDLRRNRWDGNPRAGPRRRRVYPGRPKKGFFGERKKEKEKNNTNRVGRVAVKEPWKISGGVGM